MKQNYGQQIIHTYWSINKFNNQNKREKKTHCDIQFLSIQNVYLAIGLIGLLVR